MYSQNSEGTRICFRRKGVYNKSLRSFIYVQIYYVGLQRVVWAFVIRSSDSFS